MTAPAELIDGFKALDETREAYLARYAYYAGRLPERFANQQIERLVRESAETQYRFRFSKVPVNAVKYRTQLAGIKGPTDEITARIEQIRRANQLDMIEPFITERGLVYGDVYALTWPVDEPDGVSDELRQAGVRITYQSPLSVRAMYDSEDGTTVAYVIRRWQTSEAIGKQWHAELWWPDGRVDVWDCAPGASGLDAESWTYSDDESFVHEYGLPIHHCRNALPYGRPEHADAMGPQDALTKAILTQVVVDLEAHGWRERWELLDPAAQLDAARDAVAWPDDAEAPAVPLQASGRRGPGQRHILEGRKATGEYAAPDPRELTDVADQWLRMLSVVSETPAYEYDPQGNAGLSGVARMWADRPLENRVANVKRFHAAFWRGVWVSALAMVGVTVTPEQIEPLWAPPAVINDPDWWQVATIRREHGVPQRQILLEANYAPEDVDAWLNDEKEARTLLERITLIDKLGEALQKLGSAVALGVIDGNKVDGIVTRILGVDVIESSPLEPEPAPAPMPASIEPGAGA